MCNFNEFLKTGSIGFLKLGKSLQDLVLILGEPQLIAKNKSFEIVKYNDIEVTSKNGLINQIKVSPGKNMTRIPKQLSRRPWSVTKFTTIEELLDLFHDAKTSWKIHKSLTFDRQLCIVTEKEVSVFFDLDCRELESLFISQ